MKDLVDGADREFEVFQQQSEAARFHRDKQDTWPSCSELWLPRLEHSGEQARAALAPVPMQASDE